MRLRLTMRLMSRSATRIPSPSVSGGARWRPSGEMIAVIDPPRSARCRPSLGVIEAICSSLSQPVALTTKHPLSSA